MKSVYKEVYRDRMQKTHTDIHDSQKVASADRALARRELLWPIQRLINPIKRAIQDCLRGSNADGDSENPTKTDYPDK